MILSFLFHDIYSRCYLTLFCTDLYYKLTALLNLQFITNHLSINCTCMFHIFHALHSPTCFVFIFLFASFHFSIYVLHFYIFLFFYFSICILHSYVNFRPLFFHFSICLFLYRFLFFNHFNIHFHSFIFLAPFQHYKHKEDDDHHGIRTPADTHSRGTSCEKELTRRERGLTRRRGRMLIMANRSGRWFVRGRACKRNFSRRKAGLGSRYEADQVVTTVQRVTALRHARLGQYTNSSRANTRAYTCTQVSWVCVSHTFRSLDFLPCNLRWYFLNLLLSIVEILRVINKNLLRMLMTNGGRMYNDYNKLIYHSTRLKRFDNSFLRYDIQTALNSLRRYSIYSQLRKSAYIEFCIFALPEKLKLFMLK